MQGAIQVLGFTYYLRSAFKTISAISESQQLQRKRALLNDMMDTRLRFRPLLKMHLSTAAPSDCFF